MSGSPRLLLATPATLILLLCASPPAAQDAKEVVLTDLRLFHVLLDRYRAGDDQAARDFSGWVPLRILRAQANIERQGDTASRWDRGRFEAAAMLHADAALTLMERVSGERTEDTVLFHLDAAGQLLKRAAARFSMREFASAWYVGVAGVLRDRNWLTTADRYLALGRDRLPNDGAVLYASATLSELFATGTQLPKAPASGFRATTPPPRTDPWSPLTFAAVRRSHAFYLNSAAAWLRTSLEHQPGSAMAHLHAGRVELLRKQLHDAARHLEAARRSPDTAIAYLAWLFTGALHERRGEFDHARDAYRRATECFPSGQAARIALSEMLHRAGRVEDARATLRDLLGIAPDARHDPWWHYFYDPPGVADRRLDQIRRRVRE